mgnify:FL=1|jgi:hypothetical protein
MKGRLLIMLDTIFSIGVGVVIAVIVMDYTAIMVVRVWRLLQSTADTLYGK